jgi:hypothetical protein
MKKKKKKKDEEEREEEEEGGGGEEQEGGEKEEDNYIFLIENQTVATNNLSMPLSMNLTTFTFILLTKYLTSSL